VFVNTRRNVVVALDRRSGKEVWRTNTGSDLATHPGGEHWDYFSSSPISQARHSSSGAVTDSFTR
jgi:glucose dehydrogenase